MARISVGGGVSDAHALPDQPGYIAPAPVEEPEAAPAVEEPQPEPVVEPAAEPVPAPAATPAAAAPAAAVPTSQKGASA